MPLRCWKGGLRTGLHGDPASQRGPRLTDRITIIPKERPRSFSLLIQGDNESKWVQTAVNKYTKRCQYKFLATVPSMLFNKNFWTQLALILGYKKGHAARWLPSYLKWLLKLGWEPYPALFPPFKCLCGQVPPSLVALRVTTGQLGRQLVTEATSRWFGLVAAWCCSLPSLPTLVSEHGSDPRPAPWYGEKIFP